MELIHNFIKIILETIIDIEFRLGLVSLNRNSIWRNCYFNYMNIKYEDRFYAGQNIYIRNKGNLIFGNRCTLGSFARIWNYAPIIIGDDFISAGGLTLNSGTHDPITLEPQGKEIKIGNRVWCGVNVTIISGVTIGDDVVIGAGSLVIKDVPSNSIIAGVPAKKIRYIDRNEIDLYKPFN